MCCWGTATHLLSHHSLARCQWSEITSLGPIHVGSIPAVHSGSNAGTLRWLYGEVRCPGAAVCQAYFVRLPARMLNHLDQAKLPHRSFFRSPVRIMRKLLLQSLLFALTAPVSFTSMVAQSPAPSAEQVTLAPGDSVRIVVWRKPEMSGDFIVAPDGTLSHPLYRSVRVGGVPFTTAEANLRNFLARFEQDPQFVAEPLVLIAISGEVGKPQVFAVRPETTIPEAVAEAGGPKETAKDEVRVLRKDSAGRQREFRVNLFDSERSSPAARVHSGDQIILDKRKSFFKDYFMPALGVIGSVASIGLLIDRATRR